MTAHFQDPKRKQDNARAAFTERTTSGGGTSKRIAKQSLPVRRGQRHGTRPGRS
ncbi:hypothetical protein ACIBH1_29505 [Nonomuraea sp. NPDC050663]|uniref:Uncharacterized protein n=1 Tax=Nonomuraea soli TaxID=1032476 RepID=A0A7W0CNE8_9ACTN|nr:hypothetical protein [Nonomuraea soli]MBA2894346.1 hypothetical protein [Nonomuraea soli]